MLDTNMVFVQEQHKWLNRLCKMCDDQGSLPGTMIIPENALQLPPEVFPQFEGGFGVVYKGGYRGGAVAIKSMKLYTSSNLKKCLSVGIPIRNSGLAPTQPFTEVLPRGRRMETSTAPKHSTIARCNAGDSEFQA